jgi:hypothetical protein
VGAVVGLGLSVGLGLAAVFVGADVAGVGVEVTTAGISVAGTGRVTNGLGSAAQAWQARAIIISRVRVNFFMFFSL